jgi:hypothetical protein
MVCNVAVPPFQGFTPFAALLFPFIRFLPLLAIYEMRELLAEQKSAHQNQQSEEGE